MAALDDLIQQISDEGLRNKIQEEANKLAKQKKFGLVFEEHLPECTPLYDIPVRRGSKVSFKSGDIKNIYTVIDIHGENAICIQNEGEDPIELKMDELVTIAEFGEPIYPCLKPIDSVCNAPDSNLWHTLIEADNYHALQLLEYLYAGKVDCIYIDPPYNTGAKDWKYNNNYVDGNDSYRHSKWLSFMKKRLELAKKLLNPADSVLIVTIDEKEYLHLGCLLEEMFSECRIQMISSVINHATIARVNEFNRNNEYVFFVMIGDYSISPLVDSKNFVIGDKIHWETLRRHNAKNVRSTLPMQFYPIYVNEESGYIQCIGDPIGENTPIEEAKQLEGCIAVFPIRDNGTEMVWGCRPEELRTRFSKGFVKAASFSPNKPQPYSIQYLTSGTIEAIDSGEITVTSYNNDGSVEGFYNKTRPVMPKTQWDIQYHDARDYGTKVLKKIFGTSPFSFPKSLYATHDSIRFFVDNKPNALIVDFFAGSGTTLHAVNLLNAEDGGNRRCIMVTNNEVSEAEAKELEKQGYHPGDDEWERLGIAHYVTWKRTVCSIKGHNIKGEPLKGNYIGSDIPMADGFKTNAAFFKLGFLNKDSVARREQLKELMPVLWMKAGAIGKCPEIDGNPDMIILPENKFALLNKESAFLDFEKELQIHPEIETVFIVTDSENAYRRMIAGLPGKTTYQLYRDYLDNFRINTAR